MNTHWKADEIDVTAICEEAEWHQATAIDLGIAAGFERVDAEAFVEFVFNEAALEENRPTDGPSEDLVTEEQYDRLSI